MITITHQIAFDFRDREAADLEKLNRILSTMSLENLDLKDSRGYLAVTQDGDGNLLEKRYGLDSGTLVGTPSENGYVYQIDTAVADHSVDQDEFLDIWRSIHPDRTIRRATILEFDTDYAYIILHHQHIHNNF